MNNRTIDEMLDGVRGFVKKYARNASEAATSAHSPSSDPTVDEKFKIGNEDLRRDFPVKELQAPHSPF